MTDSTSPRDPWPACPAGELTSMVGRSRARRRTQTLLRGAGATTGLLLLIAVGSLAAGRLGGPGENQHGGIACSEVQEVLADYRSGRLDADLTQQVARHLAGCELCGRLYREMDGKATAERSRRGERAAVLALAQ